MGFIRHSEEVRIREDDQFWLKDVKELNAKVTEAQQGAALELYAFKLMRKLHNEF